MLVKDIVNILNSGIPKSDSWVTEQYGPYNIRNFDKDVKKILYCVTATREIVQYFKDLKYDLLVSHHPYIQNVPMLIYHTALDCCVGGLNDMWKNRLEVKNGRHFDRNLGWVGDIAPITFEALRAKIEAFIGQKIAGYSYSDGSLISSVVICTGLGGLVFEKAQLTQGDCFITGELMSAHPGQFPAIFEVGHTLTEFIGINLIRKLLPGMQVDASPFDIDYFGTETCINKRQKTSFSGLSEIW